MNLKLNTILIAGLIGSISNAQDTCPTMDDLGYATAGLLLDANFVKCNELIGEVIAGAKTCSNNSTEGSNGLEGGGVLSCYIGLVGTIQQGMADCTKGVCESIGFANFFSPKPNCEKTVKQMMIEALTETCVVSWIPRETCVNPAAAVTEACDFIKAIPKKLGFENIDLDICEKPVKSMFNETACENPGTPATVAPTPAPGAAVCPNPKQVSQAATETIKNDANCQKLSQNCTFMQCLTIANECINGMCSKETSFSKQVGGLKACDASVSQYYSEMMKELEPNLCTGDNVALCSNITKTVSEVCGSSFGEPVCAVGMKNLFKFIPEGTCDVVENDKKPDDNIKNDENLEDDEDELLIPIVAGAGGGVFLLGAAAVIVLRKRKTPSSGIMYSNHQERHQVAAMNPMCAPSV